MKFHKFTKDKKVRRAIETYFLKLYKELIGESDQNYFFEDMWSEILQQYNPKNKWNEDQIKKARQLIYDCFSENTKTRIQNSGGIKATKLSNHLKVLDHLVQIHISVFDKPYGFADEYESIKQERVERVFSGLMELKFATQFEFPYREIPNEFWTKRFRFLKELDFDCLNSQNDDQIKAYNNLSYEFLSKKYGDSISQMTINKEDILSYKKYITMVEIFKMLKDNLNFIQVENIRTCIEMAKDIGLAIDLNKIILDPNLS